MTRPSASLRLLGTLALSGLATACSRQPPAETQPADPGPAGTTSASATLVAARPAPGLADAPEGLLQRWTYVGNTTIYGYSNGSTPLDEPAEGTLRLWPTGRYERSLLVAGDGTGAPRREMGTFMVTGAVLRFAPDRGAPHMQRYELDERDGSLTLTDAQPDRDGNYRRQTLRPAATEERSRR
ncbi:MAG TPA: hypothetical protein VFS08_05220 [Gemmatimonadaceae bacterium]|nr:hypothetical protein [Gemmatimonadaceae bacterium]